MPGICGPGSFVCIICFSFALLSGKKKGSEYERLKKKAVFPGTAGLWIMFCLIRMFSFWAGKA